MAQAKFVGREAMIKKLRRLVPAAEPDIAKAQARAAYEVADAIHARAPSDTGQYRASIDSGLVSSRPGATKLVGISESKDPHAQGIWANYIWRFIEFGTRGHIIKPKRGNKLAFKGKGGDLVAVSQVKHPGAPARPHIFPTYRQMRPKVRRMIAQAVNKAVKKVASG